MQHNCLVCICILVLTDYNHLTVIMFRYFKFLVKNVLALIICIICLLLDNSLRST